METVSDRKKMVATLSLLDSTGRSRVIELVNGQLLVVGSGDEADLRLPEEDAAHAHCILTVGENSVSIRDCFTSAGTFVDGARVREMTVRAATEVQVGSVSLAITFPDDSDPASEQCVKSAGQADVPVSESFAAGTGEFEPLPGGPEPSGHEELLTRIDNLQFDLHQANSEIEVLQNRLKSAAVIAEPDSPGTMDPYQEEMIELLKAEILELQAELAATQQQPDGLTLNPNTGDTHNDTLSRAESEKLVERLEQLLSELQARDEETATLTELLEAAENTCEAERQEREQMRQWLDEIEQRFGAREQEWRAENDRLRAELEATTVERNRAEAAVQSDCSNARLEAAQKLIQELRAIATQQRDQLRAGEQRVQQLRLELEEVSSTRSRADEMELAEERAEIARLKMELESERASIRKKAATDANLQVRALRDHLREVHEEEQRQKEENRLSNRIARLWNRLDRR